MTKETENALKKVKEVLTEASYYNNAVHVLNFDMETICPPEAMEAQGSTASFLGNQAYKLTKDPEYIKACETLYKNIDELSEFDRTLAESLHRDYLREKNVTAKQQKEFSDIYNKAFVDWINAKKENNFRSFAPSLAKVREADLKSVSLEEKEEGSRGVTVYDSLLDRYERGMTEADLDEAFNECKERLVPMLKKIMQGKKKIRTDFLSRPVSDEAQRKMADYLLHTMGFDFNRGAFTTTEHPFTDSLAKNDERVTTHYYPTMFASNMYSIIHEGGHALFDQNQPSQNFDYFIDGNKTMGQHESVSRFYENRIGRSKSFIELIYDKTCEFFPEVMKDVSCNELYEAMNVVTPSLIRTEADEFTYTFHIIIRYEIEKMVVNEGAKIEELPSVWNRKYKEYLGVEPASDREGILQDVHWTSGFGYFPTYAIGNMYNAMYYNRMSVELDIDKTVREGRFDLINKWMRENVFLKADRLSPGEWIKDITGREFTTKDFLDYLEEKYGALYEL